MWLQRQERWALLEQEHEKLEQWEGRGGGQGAAAETGPGAQGPVEGAGAARRGHPERMIFVPTSRWRDSEDASLAPPQPGSICSPRQEATRAQVP